MFRIKPQGKILDPAQARQNCGLSSSKPMVWSIDFLDVQCVDAADRSRQPLKRSDAVMKRIWPAVICTFLLGMKCIAASPTSEVTENLPSSDEVLRKVVARAKWAKAQNFQQFYSFKKSTLTEELDDKGNVKAKQEKSLRVPAKAEPPRGSQESFGTSAGA